MFEFEVELNNEMYNFSVITNTIFIKNKKKQIEIPLSALESIYVKDVNDRPTNNFLLKIQAGDTFVVGFTNSNVRDFYKGYLTYLIKEKICVNVINEDIVRTYSIKNKENDEKGVKIVKNFQMGREGIKSIESSKSGFMEFLISRPILLCIFGELNCTLTQFHNYLKQSYFYDMKNQKNVIDRILNEKLRDYSITNDGFGSRLNTHSFIELNTEDIIGHSDKKISEEEVDFSPIYPKTDDSQIQKLSDFKFDDKLNICFDIKSVAEEYTPGISYDKKILNELLGLCQEAYNTEKENVAKINAIKQKALQYKDLLATEELQSFDPRKYL